nr:hypothetical protein [uncultured Arsenicibacter sp.]
MSTRNINDATPRLQAAWAWLSEQYNERYPADPKPILTEVHRPDGVQAAYYAQGREKLDKVNELRALVGMAPITDKENKIITKRPPGKSKHELLPSLAIDISFVTPAGGLDWSPKLFERAARVIRERYADVTWGGDWNKNWKSSDERFVDMPHFEV